ncbi:MAG TPA: FMN-binding protein [Lapillicoccus sp.]|nr:FMN-binding protein [Lapillicoccus sp.]
MRRIVVAVMSTISGLVLLFSYHTSRNEASTAVVGPGSSGGSASASGSSSDASSGQSSGSSNGSADSAASGTYTGDSVMTRWGAVQVEITVSDGKITAAEAVEYPQANARDRQINAYALPVLAQEATQAQSADIDAVSGATVTSDGYIQSLQSAIDQAHL